MILKLMSEEKMSNKIISAIGIQRLNWKTFKSSSFLKEFMLFATSSVFYQGSRFIVRLVAAGILGPATYGLWNMLNLVLVYSSIIHMGVTNAMNRDVPLFKGKGDLYKVEEIRQVTLGFMSLSTLMACIGMVIGALFIANLTLRVSLQLMALLLFCTQIYSYLQVYLKSDRQFNQMSYQQFAFAGILPAIAIPLALIYALPGYILGQAVAILIISFFIIKVIPFDFKPKFNTQETVRLIKVGFPIMAVGLLYGFLTTADRWVIASFLGVEQLGYYSLAIMAMGFLSLVPIVIAQQIYPRMAETFGNTSSYSALKKWILRQIIMALSVTVPLVIGVYLIFPLIVERFLPAYMPGITAMKILLIGLLFLPLAGGFGNFLNTVGKQIYYMTVQGFAVLVNLGLNITFVKMGLGINGVAMGTAITYVTYGTVLTILTIKILRAGLSLCNSTNSVLTLNDDLLSRSAILVSEPKQVKQALTLARSIKPTNSLLLIIIGKDTQKAFSNIAPAPAGIEIEYINLFLEEGGKAEELAAKATQEFFAKCCRVYNKNLVHLLGNEVYLNFFIPLFKVLIGLKSLIYAKNITRLFLIGGHRQAYYYPVFFAEGERPFPLLYRRSWFINQFIYVSFKNLIEVRWLETPRFIVCANDFLRKWIVLGMRIYGIIRGYVWHKVKFRPPQHLQPTPVKRARPLPIIIRTKAQFEVFQNLYLFLERKSELLPIVILDHSNMPQDSILKVRKLVRVISAPNCLSVGGFCKTLFKIVQAWLCPTRTKEVFRLSRWNISLELKLQPIIRELKTFIPDLLYRQESVLAALEVIKKQINVNIGPVLTTELIAYGCALHKEAMRKAQIKMPLIVLQGVAMANLAYPFWWGDVYLLSSREFYAFALDHYQDAQDRFLYVGDFKRCGDAPLTANARKALEEILVFTQPDEYEFLFKSLIEQLCSYLKRMARSVLLAIKPHPRDRNRRWYRKLSKEYPFVQVLSEADITELCQRATVVITATSSVLYDAYRARAPIIAFLGEYQGKIPEYVQRLATRVIYGKDELLQTLKNFASLIAEAEAKYQRESEASGQEQPDGCQEISDYLSHLIIQDNGAKT